MSGGVGHTGRVTGRLVIGFDADDTLWENETLFAETRDRFASLVGRYLDSGFDEEVAERHSAVERRNLELFGFGVKSFTLSMIETAIELTDRRIDAVDIHEIVSWGKDMLVHPHTLLPGVAEVVADLTERHQLLLVTKGDLLHQETKIARSGLAELFTAIEIVSEKNPPTYAAVLARHGVAATDFMMVGDSVPSDVLPVLSLGGIGVHIPAPVVWSLERHDGPIEHDGYFLLDDITQLPPLVASLA